MNTHYIVGFTARDAQDYAMRFKEEHRGHQVRILSVEQVQHGGLRGLSGDTAEVIVLPRAWEHQRALTLGLHIDEVERRGVTVTTAKDA